MINKRTTVGLIVVASVLAIPSLSQATTVPPPSSDPSAASVAGPAG